ncbi:ExbD/TolR family protein [Limnospira fusiformis]|uniref:ExbD/TolR family protein n=1 Tax=Limnospira fusiformis TaxID=54297 RepID=UPI0014495883|nr:biopolymer transporter ExbD [Limnospira fusiformis SAG 85.79]
MKVNIDYQVDEGRIELLPLIDVVFCILTFFILAALQLTRQQAINVDLPRAGTGETQMQKMLVVGVDIRGDTYIDQQRVNSQQMQRALERFLRWNPSGLVVLYAPKDARYNDVVQVLDKMRAVGGDRVALATLPSSEEMPSPVDSEGLLAPDVLTPNNGVEPPINPFLPSQPLNEMQPGSPLLSPPGSPTSPTSPTSPLLPDN